LKEKGFMGCRLSKKARGLFQPFLVFLFVFFLPLPLHANGQIHHEIRVIFQPDLHRMEVEDQIVLPASLRPGPDGRFHFRLHDGLEPRSNTPGVTISREPQVGPGAGAAEDEIPIAQYVLDLPAGLRVFVLQYQGEIHHPIGAKGGEAFREEDSPGIISREGIFLSGRSLWIPWFDSDLVTYALNVGLPSGWHAVGQGVQTAYGSEGGAVAMRWESPEPQEDIFLVAGRWTEYRRDAGRVTARVFLRTPDRELAEKYLEATEQYLEMYQELIGLFPYKKFALIENFWERTYGLPSVTLLGPKALHAPFVLQSVYPHEILRNWWGNGVFVDRETGNWSEGLIRYLADDLVQEQNGMGTESRRAALQRYADFVSGNEAYPLSEFHSQKDAGGQAIGTGKSAFLFHMLRRELGDKVFIQALRTFFHDHCFMRASFDDLLRSFNRTSGNDLSPFFSQWVFSSGAPVLRARRVRVEPTATGFLLLASLQQQQPGPAYVLDIPLAITLDRSGSEAFQTTISMMDKEMDIEIKLPARPIQMEIDPEFDVFRRLHPAEMPPSFSKVFGAASVLIILPSTSPQDLGLAYKSLAESWRRAHPDRMEVVWDNQLEAIPKDRDVWLFGWKNRFQRSILAQLQSYGLSTNSAITRIGEVQIPRRNHSLVLAARNPDNAQHSLNWLATDLVGALGALERNLPHYGAYGYLGFEGAESKNIVKGRWPVIGSPMSIRAAQADGKWIKGKEVVMPSRVALASLPPLFSEDRLRGDIAFLSSPKMKGRGFGTPGLDRAAETIAAAFRAAGLQPGGDSERSYLQQWKGNAEEVGSGVILKNVIGVIPAKPSDGRVGSESGEKETIVIGAHYDHLGFGWPHVEKGDEGQLHPGANDNASGVALLMELARVFGKTGGLKRTLVFVAFTAKEVGFRGSEHFVSERRAATAEKIVGMINLDTIGNVGSRPLIVLGGGSAQEWPPLLREAGVASGVSVLPLPGTFGASDHVSFIKNGIPAIQLFSGINADSGRPTDTLEKIDLGGMIKAGRIAKEMMIALANRPVSLTFTLIERNDPSRMWQRRSELR